MSEKKVKITEKAFTDFTGVMFRTSFTKSVSDHPVNERMQNRITAAMRAVPMEPTVAVTGVSVSPKSASVEVKKTVQLTATVAPAGATNKKVTWASKNAEFATVDAATGLVTGVAEGLQQLKAQPQTAAIKQPKLFKLQQLQPDSVTRGGSGHPVQRKTHETSKNSSSGTSVPWIHGHPVRRLL
ncbi:Ig domain-containing protein [Klebsiella pneumoniae]|uniref:Ig-like domain-containing protein n=8 Tax=Klebsiella pneumoniae TaxID=573 RepID=UPI001D0E18AB|nr:Ig-like domain-containing protein [Klebsiella pneumoniae]